MVVKVITVKELKPLLELSHPCSAVSLHLQDEVISATPKETWDFIKDEIAKEPDITFTCSTSVFKGEPSKKFTFTGSDNDYLLQIAQFISRAVNDKCLEKLEHFRAEKVIAGVNTTIGAQAPCPLFK